METNLLLAAIAALAGAVSVLTPCVLVMLPAILAVTGGSGRRRVVGVIVGLEVSFVGISLLAAAAFASLGLPPRTQELVAVAIIALLGVTLVVPALRTRLEYTTSRAVGRVPGLTRSRGAGEGFWGGAAGGLGLGLVWAPCAGPILAAITAGSVTDGFATRTVIMSLAFGVGMLGPLLLVLHGGHAMTVRLRRRFGARRLDLVMGTAMLATAALILGGGFTTINRAIAERVNLSSTPIASIEARALRHVEQQQRGTGVTAALEASEPGELRHLGPAPKLRGIGRTYNLPKGEQLDADFLQDKVVVYDFWTYSCINCIRTLPYLRILHKRYAGDGLVIVGVHAPEFAFERDESNVSRAIEDLDVTWPVATDPRLQTWAAFHNQYWPAKYITDRNGELRYVHYGEGGYDDTEAVIRELLGKDPGDVDMPEPRTIDYAEITPETYLGIDRLDGAQWRGQVAGRDERIALEEVTYVQQGGGGPTSLEQDQFTLLGRWRLDGERAIAAGADSRIVLHYRARAAYLVLDPGAAPRATVTVRDSATVGGGTRRVVIDRDRLYTLRDAAATADGVLDIAVPAGVSAYAFTFG